MGNFELTKELDKLESRYSKLAITGDLDFSVYAKIIDEIKDKLARGRQDPTGGETLGDLPHTLYVFEVMMELAYSQPLTANQKKVGLTTSILHDVGYSILATRGDDIEEFQETFSRLAHMWAGAAHATFLLSQNGFRDYYSDAEKMRIAKIIVVHDNPSTPCVDANSSYRKGLPLDLNDTICYMHREADRMWMITPDGIEIDSHRAKRSAQAQVKHVINRFKEEKELYEDDGKFLEGLLFRTPKALEIYHANLALQGLA